MPTDNRIKCIEQYKSLIKAFADPCRGPIYHYTSAEGLRGIIENSEIWLTNVAFVNDRTECRALKEERNLFIDSEFDNKYVRDTWNSFICNPYNDKDTYIASFSRGNESLEQWRAYGTFRIGFEATKLVTHPFNLYQCVYNRKEIKKWIHKKSNVKEWKGDSLNDQFKRGAAFQLIYAASRKFKNYHFNKEKEVRAIAVSHHTWEPYPNSPSMFANDPPIYYRDHSTYKIPIPYVKLFIINEEQKERQHDTTKETSRQMKERNMTRYLLPILEVLIGPMIHREEAKVACEILLKDKGYKNVKVNVSDIPFR